MAIINYSPWQDAANMSQGISQGLGNVFLALPQLRAQMAYQAARLGLEREKMAAERPLIAAQTEREKAHTGFYNEQAGYTKERSATEQAERQRPVEAGDRFANALYPPTLGPTPGTGEPIPQPAMADAIRALIAQSGPNPDRGVSAVKEALALQGANPAVNQRLSQFILTNQKPIVEVSPAASAVDALNQPHEAMFTAPPNPAAGQASIAGWAAMVKAATEKDINNRPILPPGLSSVILQAAESQLRGFGGTNTPAQTPEPRIRKYNPETGRIE